MTWTMYDAMTWTMYDATPDSVKDIPGDAKAVAGYVDGWYVSWPLIVQLFLGKAHCLSIAVHPDHDAACCDCEGGDLTVAEVVPWVDRQLARGQWRPVVYASLDTFENQGLKGQLAHYGPRIRRWYAAYPGDGVGHILPGYDGHQEADKGPQGQNIDVSTLLDSFFPAQPKPDPHKYAWFDTGPFHSNVWGTLNERKVVEQYDGARPHWIKYRGYLNKVLRPQCKFLAERLDRIIADDHSVGHGLDKYHRIWRAKQLHARAHGDDAGQIKKIT